MIFHYQPPQENRDHSHKEEEEGKGEEDESGNGGDDEDAEDQHSRRSLLFSDFNQEVVLYVWFSLRYC